MQNIGQYDLPEHYTNEQDDRSQADWEDNQLDCGFDEDDETYEEGTLRSR